MSEKIMINRKHLSIAALLVLIVLMMLYVPRLIGPRQIYIPAISPKTETPELLRPGTSSIILSGPLARNCVFEIKAGAAGLRPINWQELTAQDPTADVIVTASVRADGALTITQLRDRGHPEAGQYIRERLSTWVFTMCKQGTIRFWFNAGALLITIDPTQLTISDPNGAPVNNGQMHFVTGSGVRIQYGAFTHQ